MKARPRIWKLLFFVLALAATSALNSDASSPANSGPLVFDAELKEYHAKAGETNANFFFSVTNISSTNVLIQGVQTSCGCTVAKLPSRPWVLPAHSDGKFDVTVDLRGKSGTIEREVRSTEGRRYLARLLPYRSLEDRIDGVVLNGFSVGMTDAIISRALPPRTKSQ